jgi:hypothetical protein
MKVNLLIMVRTENIRLIFMSEKASILFFTWNVDTRYHFVQESIEDGFKKIEFVHSDENHSDFFSKNVSHE